MLRSTLCFIACFCGITVRGSCAGEDPIRLSVKEVLASAEKERRILAGQQTLQFMNGLNYRLPIVKSLGLRYGAEDVSQAKQQYGIAFSFNTFAKIRAQEKVRQAQFDLYQTKNDVLLVQIVKERYLNISNVFYTQLELAKQQRLDSLLHTRNATLKLALQKGLTVKVKDLVETEEHLKTVRTNIMELQNNLKTGYQQIQEYVGVQHEVALNFNDFISVSKVEMIVNSLKINHSRNAPELRAFQHKINLVQSELKLEEASFNSFFDNFQLNYSTKAGSDFSGKDFGIRFGVNIPIKGNFRPKQNEYLLDMKLVENEYQFATFEQDRLIKFQILKVENLLKALKTVTEQANQGLAKTMLENSAVSMRLTAADIIDLKILQHEKEADLVKMNHELVREYLVLLELTGDLAYAPLKNYLSNQLEKY
ncbi:MAG: hypothetical protein RL329_1261 [Bacteroidota bacterium]